jgi:DNA-directed RNA polymerase specialized sigma24 family protein
VLTEQLDWDRLSPGAKWTLRHIVFREVELGWTRQEIADELNLSQAEIATRVSELRRELRAQGERGS